MLVVIVILFSDKKNLYIYDASDAIPAFPVRVSQVSDQESSMPEMLNNCCQSRKNKTKIFKQCISCQYIHICNDLLMHAFQRLLQQEISCYLPPFPSGTSSLGKSRVSEGCGKLEHLVVNPHSFEQILEFASYVVTLQVLMLCQCEAVTTP